MGRRRANNEGTVFKRQRDGKWVARVELPNGKHRERVAPTQTLAQQKLKEMRKLVEAGVEVLDSRQTVAQFLEHWLENTAKHTLKESSYESYASIVKNRIVPVLGPVPLLKLTAQHVQKLQSEQLGRNLKPASVVRTHAVLHSALEEAVRFRLLPRNPLDDVKRPRIERRDMVTLTKEQVQALVDAAGDTKFRALYAVAATVGMRRGELLALRWQDVDLEAGVLSVVRTATRIDGKGIVFTEPKTARARRKVRLADLAVRELKAHRVRQNEERLKLGSLWEDNDLVFASSVGTPLEEAHLSRSYGAALKKAEIPVIRFHDLRHTAASLLLSQNVHPKVVQEMLGHATIAITLDLYSHVVPDLQNEAVEAMNRLFG